MAVSIPNYDHIFVIVMENHSYSEVIGAPYIGSLAKQGAVAASYFATDHPSLPNYAEMTSGQSFGAASSDCDPSPSCQSTAANLTDRLDAAGMSWKSYAESMGTACNKTSGGTYYARHVPFLYYTDISASACQAGVVDYSSLAKDIQSAGTTPRFVFITPNGCNDMHDCAISTGDSWLRNNVPTILGSPAFTQQHSLLLVVWDEDDYSLNNQVALIAVGYKVKVGYVSSVTYNHYSLLRTMEAAWGFSALASGDRGANAMTDLVTS